METAKSWSHLLNCTGDGHNGTTLAMSATTNCTQWSTCAGANFVEYCYTMGLGHDVSGHLRPDGTSFLRPGSDLDFVAHMFQRFSLLVDNTILFYGHPTDAELVHKESRWPPPIHHDHEYLRHGLLLGHER